MTPNLPTAESTDDVRSDGHGSSDTTDIAAPARRYRRILPASHVEVLSQLDRAPSWVEPSQIAAQNCRAVLVRLLRAGLVEWKPPLAGGERLYCLTPTGEHALEHHCGPRWTQRLAPGTAIDVLTQSGQWHPARTDSTIEGVYDADGQRQHDHAGVWVILTGHDRRWPWPWPATDIQPRTER
ncbi:hypothetical protein [Tsukamurella tyrosinosolvens]|uniref:hypothetical protein n=1 Tax=Tsukamurella tyrosinosolvens TaxID=57704 RepID=UPI000C7F1E90|nr:hypothetical protein [Tsukamurella tyrosinosolvens]AUN41902.1 hypothetical protein ASU32_19420 [Tsukamurella tyrosinosolvens]